MQISKKIEDVFPCRRKVVTTLVDLIGYEDEAFPTAIHLFGHPGTGKTVILKQFLYECVRESTNLRVAFVNCIESYSARILFENILVQLFGQDKPERSENLLEFVEELRKLESESDALDSCIIVLDNSERLRDMDPNILPSLLRLQEFTTLNVCVVLISQIPFEKFYSKTGLPNVISLYCPQYTKSETLQILGSDFTNVQKLVYKYLGRIKPKENSERRLEIIKMITKEFFNNYVNLFLGVFYKMCRDLTEIKITSRKCFLTYIEPVLNDDVSINEVSRLWRSVAGPLRTALTQVYMRISLSEESVSSDDKSTRKLAQSLELPYYGKYLLIAAFLASYNSAKEDKRLYVKHHGKRRKRMQTVNANAKPAEKMATFIGPKSFSVDRLLAILYAILEEKVGLTCNLLSQISTLVNLKLLNFVSGENIMDGSSRLQCTVSLDFVSCISQVVGFNIRQYLGISNSKYTDN